MSFPRYPDYKSSGVEWLGEVPAHWKVSRIGRLTRSGMGQTILRDMLEMEPSAETLPVYSASEGDDVFGHFANPSVRLSPGDLIVGARGSIGMTRRVVSMATCTQTTIWIKLSDESVDSAFLYWCLVGGREGLFPFDKTAIPMLTVEQVRSGDIPAPPAAEQTRIAEFLDRETAKIDHLVAEQRRLMELLKEKRQAVISHAVTRGLNPKAPLKPSGIEWLGDIPSHWETAQSRRMFSVRSEPALDKDRMLTASQKYGVLYQSDFVEREGRRVVEVIMGTESLKHVEPDDFIISMRSFQGGLEWSRLRGSTSFHYVMITPVKWVHPPFFAHLFKSTTYIQALQTTTDLIRDGQELRFANFAQVDLPVVPMDEQLKITAYLDKEIAKFDTLAAEAQRAIDLLQERRTALISAAVTGQIDVRGLAGAPT